MNTRMVWRFRDTLDRPKYYKQAVNEDGAPMFDENGDPVWVGDPEKQLLLDDQIDDGRTPTPRMAMGREKITNLLCVVN